MAISVSGLKSLYLAGLAINREKVMYVPFLLFLSSVLVIIWPKSGLRRNVSFAPFFICVCSFRLPFVL